MLLSERRLFLICAILALFTEVGIIMLSGAHLSRSVFYAPPPKELTEVELVTLPEEPYLVSANAPKESAPEETLSDKKVSAKPSNHALSQPSSNQIQNGKPLSATHGPVLIESPAPVIPDYLKSQDLNAKVVIEFSVFSNGNINPKLLISSGNEELDQIALATAKKWKFYPAEKEHQAIDAKVRLRILFEVK